MCRPIFADLAANLIDDVLSARPVMRWYHHMGDPEVAVSGQRRTQASLRQPFGPQLSWNIGHYADAITLAIDIARSMPHASKGFNRPL